MEPTVQREPTTRLFTFGYGQTCPFTGVDLGDHYALVTAPDGTSALRTMLATFGRNWAFEYDPASPNIADYLPRMKLHAHLVVGVEIDVPEPDPTGLTHGRDPERFGQKQVQPGGDPGRGAPFDEPVGCPAHGVHPHPAAGGGTYLLCLDCDQCAGSD